MTTFRILGIFCAMALCAATLPAQITPTTFPSSGPHNTLRLPSEIAENPKMTRSEAALASLKSISDQFVERTGPSYLKTYEAASIFCTSLDVAMFYPEKISKLSTALRAVLYPVDEGLGALTNVPYIGRPASLARPSVEKARTALKKLKDRMDDVTEETSGPTSTAVKYLLRVIPTSTTLARALVAGLPKYVEWRGQDIVKYQNTQVLKSDAADLDEEVASRINEDVAIVKALNTAYGVLIPKADVFHGSSEITEAFEPFKETYDGLEDFKDKLSPIESDLREADNILKKRIKEGFPYPSPTVKDPFRTKTYHLHISIKDVLDGESKIKHAIEHDLSSTLYKALKVFGLSKMVKKFVSEGEKDAKRDFEKLAMKAIEEVPGGEAALQNADKAIEALRSLSDLSDINLDDAIGKAREAQHMMSVMNK